MISGAHIILCSTDAEADRVFIRDVLGFVGVDAGSGWLIFKLPPAEIAVRYENTIRFTVCYIFPGYLFPPLRPRYENASRLETFSSFLQSLDQAS